MNWTVLVAFCIIDDLFKTLGHRDDPQSKTPASVVLTRWILAALTYVRDLFSLVPSAAASADGCTACTVTAGSGWV